MGEPLKDEMIPIMGETGRRYYGDGSLKIFKTKEECLLYFQKQIKSHLEYLEKFKPLVLKLIDIKITELNKQLNGII